MDVPCSALGDNIGVPIAVLFTLIVLLGVANSLVQNGTVSDTLHDLQHPTAVLICPAWPVWYRVQTGAACPTSGRVCRALRGLLWFWHGLRGCLRCAVFPGALGLAGVAGGVYRQRRGWGGEPSNHRKNKKGSKKSPRPLLSISKIFCKNKKTPTKGLCSVLYLPYKP